MVSTRQMTTGGSSGQDANQIAEYRPAKFTRNSAINAVPAVAVAGPSTQATTHQTVNFLDLPPEVIEKIFSYLKYKNICQLRLVCRTIDSICGHILNSTFNRLQSQMFLKFQDIKKKMPRRESARRSHHLAGESDLIETLHMRLTLLQMSFGKHIERKHIYFFPGEILDEVYHILYYIKVTPKLDLPYKVTDELFDLSTMAMEYFKEKIEPHLPEIAYFNLVNYSATSSTKYLDSTITSDVSKDSNQISDDILESEDTIDPTPQSNMVLRKRIRKIKQGMKKYNNQLTLLRQDLRSCRRKTQDQQKQITDQQKQLADQAKQTLEYATRLDEYDKKNEEISRKFSTLLQELNKCKTELQYWRSKNPPTPVCTACGNQVLPPAEELQALMNQGVNPEVLGLNLEPLQAECTEPNTESVISATNAISATNVISETGKKNVNSVTILEMGKKDVAVNNIDSNVENKLNLPSVSPICVKNQKRKAEEIKDEVTTKKTRSRLRVKKV